jgi:hypothetical protein
MSGMWKGYADGMQDSRSRESESEASRASLAASLANDRADQARGHAQQFQSLAQTWKATSEKNLEVANVQTAKLSGCLVVINAMIKTMEEEMSPMQREKFRDKLVQRARSRIVELDKERIPNGNLGIEEHFKSLEQNKILGVV